MPGRFTITKKDEEVKKRFNVRVDEGAYHKRYNASPSQGVAVILDSDPSKVSVAHWGWNPRFIKHIVINARSEGLESNRLFSKALRERRCLVLMDGYYEWEETPFGKKPYRVTLKDESLFSVAGLWIEEEGELHVATITTQPNELVGKIHHRMPAILDKKDEKRWLSKDTDPESIQKMLKPYPAKEMTFYRVSDDVNSSSHDRKEYILPLSEAKAKEEPEHQTTLVSSSSKAIERRSMT